MRVNVMLFLSTFLFLMTGCSSGGGEDVPSPTPTPEKDVVSLPTKNYSVNAEEGNLTVSFTASTSWTATSSEDWCVLSASSGSKGSQSITLTIAENTETSDRTATVTIKSGTASATVTITQKAKTVTLELTEDHFEVSSAQTDVTIRFTVDADWTAESDQDWCVLSATSGNEGSQELVVTIATNETGEVRTAKVTLKSGSTSQTVTIVQDKNFYISVTNEACEISFIGGIIEVEISSNVDYEISIDASWIKQTGTADAGSVKQGTLEFEVESNSSEEERKATITFTNKEHQLEKTVVVTQKGMPKDDSVQPSGNLGNMTWG